MGRPEENCMGRVESNKRDRERGYKVLGLYDVGIGEEGGINFPLGD